MIRRELVQKDGGLVARVTFSLPSSIWMDRVCLVGDFNSWNPESHPFGRADDGCWVLTMDFQCGKSYQFRYLVDRREWMNDNQADTYIVNEFGSTNGVLTIDSPT
jgi:1,4-alpha-glucan branching enzyme